MGKRKGNNTLKGEHGLTSAWRFTDNEQSLAGFDFFLSLTVVNAARKLLVFET